MYSALFDNVGTHYFFWELHCVYINIRLLVAPAKTLYVTNNTDHGFKFMSLITKKKKK